MQPYLRRVFRRCSVSIGHVSWAPVPVGRTAQGGAGSYRCNERVRTEGPAGKKKARLANQPGLEVLGEDA
ncbi:coniferyl aldehyde dehydrogenase [Qipengyuania citrea LAMA 915]|uniref:Coniferyl aldehyde dehydrogenase n=1 Tax=Qipengyuania citrea LAMA 915 TaxID=1306953 RepID=A0A0L1KAU1_9SPHN|nr:coniferyl aldehyde dehydrogenase [Qipengyuania citrea LAMA 915]